MKDIRIFVASSKELLPERNYLAYLTLAHEEGFEKRGIRVRLSKWEYVDPKMTKERTEDRYLNEMYACDAALILFRNVAGMYTREEMDKALAAEQTGSYRLKAHRILFSADGEPGSDAAKLREGLPDGSYGTWSARGELRDEFLSLVDEVAQREGLCEAPSDAYVRKITAFLAADEELAEERNAFADTVLNVNDLLEQAHRNIRVRLRFYDPEYAEEVMESSEMGLVLYGTNYRMFGKEEIDRIYARVKDESRNPKRFYVFFRDLDDAAEKSLDEAFKTFRSDFVTKLGHFTCQFGDANALRLGFLLSLERYAGESIKEIYSTVSAPTTSVFVGREEELRRLCGLLEPVPGQFPAGRLPVITGAGGTGKSELVRQYTSQLRVQYPGGVFQVDMEHVKTWDDAFLGVLDGVPNNGVTVREYLGLEDSKDNDRNQAERQDPEDDARNITGEKVREALLRKARESGPILLVLDNVEGCMPLLGRDGGFTKAFPTGFSERVRVNVVATARVCDVMLRPTDWAVPFPLDDLSPEAALEILLADRPDADAEERKAAKRVAELLGYRALYLRRVPALIGDLYAQTVCDSYAELAKSLEENLLETVAEETEGTHLPDLLWKMTRERLAKMPLGAECVKLAQVASFFSPDGFPRHILLHLWKTVVAPGLDEKKFARAFEIVRHHNIFQSVDPVRIHRLDRAAILSDLGMNNGKLLEEIGKVLKNYPGASRDIWLLLTDFPTVFDHVPKTLLNGDFFVRLLVANPKCADICQWDMLDGRDWSWLLRKQPQFANKCPWEKLDGKDWSRLLCKQPQFVVNCPWEKLSGRDWVCLLRERPCFSEMCPWEKLSSWDWACLLCDQPQFREKCPWEKLSSKDWLWLLKGQPKFAEKCPWEKVVNFSEYGPTNIGWVELLISQPRFASKCPWENMSGSDWELILCMQPQFADRCPWEKLDGGDWAWLLGSQPQFADRCPWEELAAQDWVTLLGECEQLQFVEKCPWEKFSGLDWTFLLMSQPQLVDKCPWEKMDGVAWAYLLCVQPEFADKCSWEKLDGGDWVELLKCEPQFVDKCDWGKLSDEDWDRLLSEQPQFADRRVKNGGINA